MSRDIRSYFLSSGGNKKNVNAKVEKNDSVTKPKKRQIVILDSDSDEDLIPVQVKKHKGNSGAATNDTKVERKVIDTKEDKTALKPITAADVFGDSGIKRSAPKASEDTKKHKNNAKLTLEDNHSDAEFEATLLQLDEIDSSHKKGKKKKPEERNSDSEFEAVLKQLDEREESYRREREKEIHNKKQTGRHSDLDKGKDKHTHSHNSVTSKHKHSSPKKDVNNSVIDKHKHKHLSPKKEVKDKSITANEKFSNDKREKKKEKEETEPVLSRTPTNSDKKYKTDTKKTIKDEVDTTKCDTPLERKNSASTDDSFSDDPFEKKRLHAMQYQRYLQREGPRNPGGKEIPEGKPGCLSGLVFVLTGVLETIDRDQTASLIQQYGGRVTQSISRNTSYLVVGDEPGPSKIEKATKLGTKQLTEDGLLDLIRDSSGSSNKPEGKSIVKKKSTKEEPVNVDKNFGSIKNDQKNKQELKVPEKRIEKTSPPSTKIAAPVSAPTSIGHVSTSSSLWVDKYKPSSIKQIIGQQGDRSNVKKLLKWLEKWHSNHSGKKKLARPSPWAKDDFGSFFKAALLSGPPGVGKTTTAHLVSKELGFDIVEFNASDTRSKKLLHEEVSELLSTKSLSGYFHDASGAKPTEKHVLIMDEVDGMAGNEDRGGVQELIQLIKNSRVPIICMCNDRHHPKIRSLTNYCFDLQFSRPRVEQIRGAMMSICFKEGIKIPPEALNDIINGANHDIRQVLHHLSMWSVKDKNLSIDKVKAESEKAKKNLKLGPWDVLRKVFSADAHKTMSIYDKSDLFFHDYSLGPLFVQENYLSVLPHKANGNKNKHLSFVARTAESLSSGDLIEKSIRSKNAWSLLPMQAMYSSVIPGDIMEGHLTTQINFPAWLGKNSRRNKFNRLVQELHMHMRLSISGSREAVNLDYLQHIRDAIVNPLIKEGADGVPATLSVMQNYYLMREDIDSVMELSLWPNQKDPMSLVESKVKAALTRTYNKEGIMTPYSIVNIKKTSAKSSQDADMDLDGEDNIQDEEEEGEEDITKDAMIKAKKRPASTKDSAAGGSGAKKARGGASGKGNTKKESKGKGK